MQVFNSQTPGASYECGSLGVRTQCDSATEECKQVGLLWVEGWCVEVWLSSFGWFHEPPLSVLSFSQFVECAPLWGRLSSLCWTSQLVCTALANLHRRRMQQHGNACPRPTPRAAAQVSKGAMLVAPAWQGLGQCPCVCLPSGASAMLHLLLS